MRNIAIVIVFVLLCGCGSVKSKSKTGGSLQPAPTSEQSASDDIVYGGGDGSSMEQAVIIKAPNNGAGVYAEAEWIRMNHPGWKEEEQALVGGDDGKYYDRIDYTTPQGETKTIFFDITDFLGKW